ncbi:uncharacterized protein LOC126214899 [Schistocerca nitens]|uniref:uncharacterized protein LOC126214899 n=1 Tax=Schistocerca nitens TaxID=7011 RepID=UPI002118DC05|nr:uncharacterized protein LOC126214899 [Schistocerca nitens]
MKCRRKRRPGVRAQSAELRAARSSRPGAPRTRSAAVLPTPAAPGRRPAAPLPRIACVGAPPDPQKGSGGRGGAAVPFAGVADPGAAAPEVGHYSSVLENWRARRRPPGGGNLSGGDVSGSSGVRAGGCVGVLGRRVTSRSGERLCWLRDLRPVTAAGGAVPRVTAYWRLLWEGEGEPDSTSQPSAADGLGERTPAQKTAVRARATSSPAAATAATAAAARAASCPRLTPGSQQLYLPALRRAAPCLCQRSGPRPASDNCL